MIVVIDANVFVSALISSEGAPARILDLWRDQLFQLAVSEEVIEEIEEVVARPRVSKYLIVSRQEVRQLIIDLTEAAIPFDSSLTQPVSADPDDDLYLALALEARADYIVSGDRHLISMHSYHEIPILSPRVFLILLETDMRYRPSGA